jgi:quercetin dioxygenase-like cupin family protein
MEEREDGGKKCARAEKLVDLVSYQNGAVVSREVVNKATGTITAFAFDRGQGLSEHTAPFDAFVYVAEGRAEITIEGTAHLLGQGDMIIMPAHKPHALKAHDRFKMLLVMIRS